MTSTKDIAIESSGNITVDGSKIELNGNTKSFVTFEDLDEALQIFMKALNLHVHSSSGSPPATTMVLDINGSQTQTVKTGG